MGIVTKTGDKGKTSLYCGKRVCKDSPRIELCGTLDEVVSFLGMAKAVSKDKKTGELIHAIQKELFIICTEIVTSGAGRKKLKKRIDKGSICGIEKEIDFLESKRRIRMKGFCIPGGNMASSALDIARAITRRAERRGVTLFNKGIINNRDIVVYLNRLSDLLYLLARLNEKKK